jgi:anaerobic magnesium-protoporphyrin IX monomethyl ester cyclase
LQYLVWLHRQKIIGWWQPSERAKRQGRMWVPIWKYAFRPMLKAVLDRRQAKLGWEGRYRLEIERQAGVNVFKDLEEFLASAGN